MKVVLNTAISAILLICSTLVANAGEYQKQFSKNYPIDPFAELLVNTSFSNVQISNWDKNEIEVAIVVKVNADSEEKANKIFDRIKVDLIGNKSKVEVRTQINNMNSKSGNYVIEISIKAPAEIHLNAKNSFGDIIAGKIAGKAEVNCDYGKFVADFLASADNDLHSSFGNLIVKKLAGGKVNSSFGNLEITELTGNTEMSSSYGELKVDLVNSKVSELKVNSEFGNTTIVLSNECNMTIKASISMGSMSNSGKIEVISNTEQFGSGSFNGKIGQGSGKLTCNASFGNVSISSR